jgi:hypothetical protein
MDRYLGISYEFFSAMKQLNAWWGFAVMSKFEKRLVICALVFVVIYLGAAVVTIHTRLNKEDRIERLESSKVSPAEGKLLMVELFLPVAILFTLTVCFLVVRKQRAKRMLLLDEADEEFEDPAVHQQDEK